MTTYKDLLKHEIEKAYGKGTNAYRTELRLARQYLNNTMDMENGIWTYTYRISEIRAIALLAIAQEKDTKGAASISCGIFSRDLLLQIRRYGICDYNGTDKQILLHYYDNGRQAHQLTCAHCGQEFHAYRTTTKYCCTTCKKEAQRNRNKS
jgi:hypothetical protein